MNQFENIFLNENKITRMNIPEQVFEELAHQENVYPQFHAFNYTKSCITPEDCVYTIKGTSTPEGAEKPQSAILTITYKKEASAKDYSVTSHFELYPDQDKNDGQKIAA